jgi:putative ABC transport system ATP-binding protein
VIEVKNLTKVYGKKESAFTALDDVSFSVPDGARVAIIGKSGSGKSTLMHIMSGLDSPTSGSVSIGGRVLANMKQKSVDSFRAKQMSFIFQAFFVEGNQTCFQNVMLPLEIARVGRRRRKAMVVEALNEVELSDKSGSRANDLSGGQKQRLAIARAIVNKPKLIFADEPTGNLDSATGEMIINLLFDLNKTMGSTLIVVTHDHELAAKCQMQIQLKDGKIIDIKKPKNGVKRKIK